MSSAVPHPYPFRDRRIPCYVDGEFVTEGRSFENVDPVDGSTIALITEADACVVDRAVRAAHKALHGPWGKMALQDRCALLHEVANRIEHRFADFVAAEIADTGKTYAHATQIDIPRGVANFRVFADLACARSSEYFEMNTTDGRGALNYSVNKPLGVVAIVSPWNLPFLLMTWKVAPALACGNTLVVKPSEETPSSSALLAEVMHEAGMPLGVFNLVHGFGGGSTGEFLVSHPNVNAVAFTGESATGSAIMKSAAKTVKSLSFELGGKNAAIVFADADFDAAVSGTVRSAFSNSGQVCMSTERVYVEQRVFGRFVEAVAARARAIRLGGSYDGSDMGPLISAKHREKVVSYYELAKAEGAEVVAGGGVPKFGDRRDGGSFVEPTILCGLAEKSRCVTEEIFGPVCHIAPFGSEEEAIAKANDTPYGLAAAVWTSNVQRAHRVARQMEVGVAWVNEWYLRDLRTPFGGVKISGIGREGGMHSLAFFSEPMNICVKL